MIKDPHRYDDMLYMPHHRSEVYPPMSLQNRAAQFSPFAALVGYDEQVAEEARLTHRRHSLSDCEKQVLDEKLRTLFEHIHDEPRPEIKLVYFKPDALKAGGSYETYTGAVKKIDLSAKAIVFFPETFGKNPMTVPLEDVLDMDSPIFADLDF